MRYAPFFGYTRPAVEIYPRLPKSLKIPIILKRPESPSGGYNKFVECLPYPIGDLLDAIRSFFVSAF